MSMVTVAGFDFLRRNVGDILHNAVKTVNALSYLPLIYGELKLANELKQIELDSLNNLAVSALAEVQGKK